MSAEVVPKEHKWVTRELILEGARQWPDATVRAHLPWIVQKARQRGCPIEDARVILEVEGMEREGMLRLLPEDEENTLVRRIELC